MQMLDLVDRPLPKPYRSNYAIAGKDYFLRLEAMRALRLAFGGDGDGFTRHEGPKVDYATLADDLGTGSLFGGTRVALVDDADTFVTKNRAALEKLASNAGRSGVLVLVVDSMPSNTKLAKIIGEEGTLRCEVDAKGFNPASWCRARCQQAHGKKLMPEAAQIVAEQHGKDLGLLDMELAKLAAAAPGDSIDASLAESLSGTTAQAVVWKVFDAIAAGQASLALRIMDDQFSHGGTPVENSMKFNGALAFHMRRVAKAGRKVMGGTPMRQALNESGIAPFAAGPAEKMLMHLGRRRIARLSEDLVRLDMALKGGSRLPHRALLERFIIRLSGARE
jgi:DNA polymerase-3 subunit delta